MKRSWSKLGLLSLTTVSLLFLSQVVTKSGSVQAENKLLSQVIDGVIPSYFTKSPRLLGAVTTFRAVRVSFAKYYFNLALPVDAGNSLKQVEIAQRQGFETIDFKLEQTKVFLGTNRKRQEQIAISDVTQSQETGAILVTLAEAVPPGTNLTVSLKPRRNPDVDGVYLFGVTAYPQGENPYGLYLGVGRLHFEKGSSSFY